MKSPSEKAEEYARENADAQDRELICQASFYAGTEGGCLAGHLEGQKDALDKKGIVCPFCHEDDFDKLGLAIHLTKHCEEFKAQREGKAVRDE